MHRDMRRITVFAFFVGIACLVTLRCLRVTVAGPVKSLASPPAAALPFVAADLTGLPRAWYCLSPWSSEITKERQGIALFSWRLFIALNWPGVFQNAEDQTTWTADVTMDGLNKAGEYPRWSSWPTPRSLGAALASCSARGYAPDWINNPDPLTPWIETSGYEADQTKPPPCVYDQNGEIVEYEIRMRPEGWASNIYQTVCPSAASTSSTGASFQYSQCQGQGPAGGDTYDQDGAIAIKLAWKVLSEAEIQGGRYLQRIAKVREACVDKAKTITKAVGLVGLNIAQKTNNYDGWIWSTFEHVNNLTPPHGTTAASFYNPQCHDCVPNTSQRLSHDSKCRTQITRVTPIADDIKDINEKFRAFLKDKSVLQYYELIGAQYVPFSSAGQPAPAELRNSVIETYDVPRDPPSPPKSCVDHPEGKASSCLGCHKDSKTDFSFVPQVELCNCGDKAHRWVSDQVCEKLGLNDCPRSASP